MTFSMDFRYHLFIVFSHGLYLVCGRKEMIPSSPASLFLFILLFLLPTFSSSSLPLSSDPPPNTVTIIPSLSWSHPKPHHKIPSYWRLCLQNMNSSSIQIFAANFGFSNAKANATNPNYNFSFSYFSSTCDKNQILAYRKHYPLNMTL